MQPERAGVIYMTEPPSGLTGTAFWKSKDTGLDNIDLNDIESHNDTLRCKADRFKCLGITNSCWS